MAKKEFKTKVCDVWSFQVEHPKGDFWSIEQAECDTAYTITAPCDQEVVISREAAFALAQLIVARGPKK